MSFELKFGWIELVRALSAFQLFLSTMKLVEMFEVLGPGLGLKVPPSPLRWTQPAFGVVVGPHTLHVVSGLLYFLECFTA